LRGDAATLLRRYAYAAARRYEIVCERAARERHAPLICDYAATPCCYTPLFFMLLAPLPHILLPYDGYKGHPPLSLPCDAVAACLRHTALHTPLD